MSSKSTSAGSKVKYRAFACTSCGTINDITEKKEEPSTASLEEECAKLRAELARLKKAFDMERSEHMGCHAQMERMALTLHEAGIEKLVDAAPASEAN